MSENTIDLFGVKVQLSPYARTPEEIRKARNKKYSQARGWAAPPGTGPEGESCRTCAHSYVGNKSGKKNYWKCALVKATKGAGTDIRLKWPACRRWKQKEESDG